MTFTNRRTFLTGTMAGAATLALQPELFAGVPRLGAPITVALVGCGRQGRALIDQLAKFEEVTLVGLCDPVAGRLRRAGRRAKDGQAFAELDAMLRTTKPDVLVVATPTHRHRAPVEAGLAAGCHVYCEAPLAHTREDVLAIVAASRASDRVVHVGLLGRTNPVYEHARDFYRAGVIEDAVVMRAHHHDKNSMREAASDPADEAALNWKLDPAVSLGLPGEFGTHQFDVVHWFTGRYPQRVSGSGGVVAWKDGRQVADTVSCDLAFDGGVRLGWDATLGNSFQGTEEVLCGTMGSIRLAWTSAWLFKEADAPTNGWEVYAKRQPFHNDEGIILVADATKLAAMDKLAEGATLPNPPAYYGIEAFLRSATEGREVVVPVEEGARATLVGIAAHQAVVTGEPVTIPEADLALDD